MAVPVINLNKISAVIMQLVVVAGTTYFSFWIKSFPYSGQAKYGFDDNFSEIFIFSFYLLIFNLSWITF